MSRSKMIRWFAGALAVAVVPSATSLVARADVGPGTTPTGAQVAGQTEGASATRQLTLQGAIDVALGGNPDVALATENLATAGEQDATARSRRLPSLKVDASANYYLHPYSIAFALPGVTPVPSFTLYNHFTTSTTVALSEPLTGLLYLSEAVGAAEHNQKAVDAELDRAKLEIAYRTAADYIGVLRARANADIAHKNVADIESELARSTQLRDAGSLTDIDVLRFKSAKAAADQTAVRADVSVQTALSAMILRLGMHDGARVDVADSLPTPPPPLAIDLEQAQKRAIQARPELRGAQEKIAAAEAARVQAREQYVPDIRAVAAYIHTSGVQPFQPADAEFLGLTASWNVWDWGVIHHSVVEAEHAKAREQVTANALYDSVQVEVRDRWLDAKADYDNLAAADTQVQTAEEAFRLQKARFDAGAATTTDVLDAETEVARGRQQFAIARYDYYTALVALARAIGNFPQPGAAVTP